MFTELSVKITTLYVLINASPVTPFYTKNLLYIWANMCEILVMITATLLAICDF